MINQLGHRRKLISITAMLHCRVVIKKIDIAGFDMLYRMAKEQNNTACANE